MKITVRAYKGANRIRTMAPYVTHSEMSTVTNRRSASTTEPNEPPISTRTSASVTHKSMGAYPYSVFCTSS